MPKKKPDKENTTNTFPSRKNKGSNRSKYFKQHDDVVNSHIPYGVEANTSPHIIMKQLFHYSEKNSIILSFHGEQKTGKNHQMLYKVDSFGENVNYNCKNNFYNLNVDGTKNNKIFVLVKYKDVRENPKLSFFTETGTVVDHLQSDNTKGYVLLVTVQVKPRMRKEKTVITQDDILLANRYLQNQT